MPANRTQRPGQRPPRPPKTRPDEKGRPLVHPPPRVGRAHGQVDARPLPRPTRRKAAAEAEGDAVHAPVLSRHDSLAPYGGRRTSQARHRPVVRSGTAWSADLRIFKPRLFGLTW